MRIAIALVLLLAAPAFAEAPAPQAAAPDLPALAKLPPVPDGQARLIVVRESSFSGMLASARVSANDQRLGSLGNGDAAAFDVAPGSFELRVANSLNWFGYVKARLAVAAGETHYISLSPNGSGLPVDQRHDAEGPLALGQEICDGSWCIREVPAADIEVLLKGVTVAPPKK